jgi:hypothetical protein
LNNNKLILIPKVSKRGKGEPCGPPLSAFGYSWSGIPSSKSISSPFTNSWM